jgi:transcriptional regulator with XRE-family HTH domain
MGVGMTVGQRVHGLLQSRNMEQKVLADKIGVTESYVCHIVKDRREPSIRVIQDMANAFGMPTSTFMQRVRV